MTVRGWAHGRGDTVVASTALALGLLSALAFYAVRRSLWEDEIIAATHALQPLPSFFIQTLRNDIHPPFYFLFLKLWSWWGHGSDRWLLTNSLVSAMASAAAVAGVAGRLAGARAALWAAAWFCVLPNFAWSAGTLRMYGLLPGVAVGTWYFWRAYATAAGSRNLWAAIGLQTALLLTHAIEFYFAAFIVLAVLVETWHEIGRERLRRIVLVQAGLLLVAVPLALSALARGTEPLPASSITLLLTLPAQLFAGWALSDEPWALAAGTAVAAVLLACAWAQRGPRVLALLVGLAPVVAAGLVGFLGKPIFKPPVFTANCVPFLVLAASLVLAKPELKRRRTLAQAGLLAVALATLPWSRELLPEENYRPAAEQVMSRVQPGDVIVVPRISVFWGVMRYSGDSRWGRPLEVMPPSNAAWSQLKGRLGPAWSEALGLDPRSQAVDVQGVRFVQAVDAGPFTEGVRRVWVVHRRWYPDTVQTAGPMSAKTVHWSGQELSVTLLEADPAGVYAHGNPPPPPLALPPP